MSTCTLFSTTQRRTFTIKANYGAAVSHLIWGHPERRAMVHVKLDESRKVNLTDKLACFKILGILDLVFNICNVTLRRIKAQRSEYPWHLLKRQAVRYLHRRGRIITHQCILSEYAFTRVHEMRGRVHI